MEVAIRGVQFCTLELGSDAQEAFSTKYKSQGGQPIGDVGAVQAGGRGHGAPLSQSSLLPLLSKIVVGVGRTLC